MIDRQQATNWMRARLLDVALIPPGDVAWMNRQFSPVGKNIYVDESMVEITAARDSSLTEYNRLQYVYRVFAKAKDRPGENYAEQAEEMVKKIADAYPINARPFELDTAQMQIMSVEPGTPSVENDWWMNRVVVTVQLAGDLPEPFDI